MLVIISMASESVPATKKIGMGIDTGGTFTDCVIVDMNTREVLAKAKSPTTYEDLSIGIKNSVLMALNAFRMNPEDIRLVGISTTIATNSILQGRGGKVGLIGIGWKPSDDWNLGCDVYEFIRGGHDSLGNQNEPLDVVAVDKIAQDMAGQVDAIAIAGLFSVCNPSHEIRAKDIVRKWTDVPVVLSHVLTGDLGIYERAVTAVLNAKLIPVMHEFMASVEKSLHELGLKSRIMVFKGDGGLMSLEMAKERPIETILSGPAASLMGAKVLGKVDNCVVVDIGGTSTDIAFLEDGFPRLVSEGAVVGGWRTRVKAVDMWTCGLGGDSCIWIDDDGELQIGPERVVPLAVASASCTTFRERLRRYSDLNFYLASSHNTKGLREPESKILQFLIANGPSTLFEVMDGVTEVVLTREVLNSLKRRGRVLQTGLTPTDIMHVANLYMSGDIEASEFGVRYMAEKAGYSRDDFIEKVLLRMSTRVGEEIIRKIIYDETGISENSKILRRVLQASTGEKRFDSMNITTSFDRPIVAIGAPAEIFVAPLEKRMRTRVIIPDNYDVGNAIGAVCSQIMESITVRVYPKEAKFLVFAPGTTPIEYGHVEEAVASAKSYASRFVADRVSAAGIEGNVSIKIDIIERRFSDGYGKEMKFINWVDVRATAMGIPKV